MIYATFKTTKSILALSSILLITSMLQSAPFVYVGNRRDATVSVIDAATNDVVTTITIPDITNVKNGIAISPDGKIAYVPCYNTSSTDGTIQRIDTATQMLLTPIPLGQTPNLIDPDSIAITPNGAFAYVTAQGNSGALVLEINLSTNGITPATDASSTLISPATIVIAPNGKTAYVLDLLQGIIPIDLLTNSVVGSPITGTGLAVSPDGAYLYISDARANQINQFDITGSYNLMPQIERSFGYSVTTYIPFSLVISPDGKTLYASSNGNPRIIGTIDIADPTNPMPSSSYLDLNSLGETPYTMAITSDGKTLYGTIASFAQTIAVDITSPLAPMLTKNIPVGNFPRGVAITPILPPSSISGCKTKNVFLLQTDYINKLTWSAPTAGTPTAYNIYRDAGLTDLAGTSTTLEFYDHNRNPNVTYTYYVTSAINGAQSIPATVTVTNPC